MVSIKPSYYSTSSPASSSSSSNGDDNDFQDVSASHHVGGPVLARRAVGSPTFAPNPSPSQARSRIVVHRLRTTPATLRTMPNSAAILNRSSRSTFATPVATKDIDFSPAACFCKHSPVDRAGAASDNQPAPLPTRQRLRQQRLCSLLGTHSPTRRRAQLAGVPFALYYGTNARSSSILQNIPCKDQI